MIKMHDPQTVYSCFHHLSLLHQLYFTSIKGPIYRTAIPPFTRHFQMCFRMYPSHLVVQMPCTQIHNVSHNQQTYSSSVFCIVYVVLPYEFIMLLIKILHSYRLLCTGENHIYESYLCERSLENPEQDHLQLLMNELILSKTYQICLSLGTIPLRF